MMSWMPTSASQPAKFSCDVAVQLLAPPVAIGACLLAAGQCRTEAGDVVAQHLVDVLSVRRCFFEQPQGGVEDRHQAAACEVPVREEVALELCPRRLVVGRQCRCPGLERLPFPGEIAAGDGLPE